ncbi:MAG: rod-binding protein [Deltaproteobacteria bacterium]|nr:rod-binding protein [Deltaproteobacteria bacterium]
MSDSSIKSLGAMQPLSLAGLSMAKEPLPLKRSAIEEDPTLLLSGVHDSPEKIEEAATQFEGLLLQQMFRSMWSTVPREGLFGNGREEEFYRDMLNQALAESVAENQSIGIKEVMAKDIAKIAGRGEKK